MLLSRGGFEGTRPRAQKKSEAKIKNRSLENRPQRGQKHECLGKDTTRKCSPKKNTSLLKKLQIFRETQAFSKKRKNLRSKKSQIFSKKNVVKIFSRVFWQDIFENLQASRPNSRTSNWSSKTPPLLLNLAQNLAVQKHD